jgi:hypothetical protein
MKRLNNTIIFYFIFFLVIGNQGCYHELNNTLQRKEIFYKKDFIVISIQLSDGSKIFFNKAGGKYFYHESGNKKYCAITGVTKDNKFVEINLDRIKSIDIQRNESSGALTTIGIFMQVPLALLIAYIIAEMNGGNCPSLYIGTDDTYNLEAQLLRGAYTAINKRSDYHFFHSDGLTGDTIKIMLRNDNSNERQFIDEIKLFKFELPESSQALADENNNFYEILSSEKIYSNDSSDNFKTIKGNEENLRDSIFIDIPSEKTYDSIKLIIEGTSTYWGSELMRGLIESQKNRLEYWYKSPSNHVSEIDKFTYLTKNAELSIIKIKQLINSKYESVTSVKTLNNIKTDKNLITIHIQPDGNKNIRLLITPPKTFWRISGISLCKKYKPIKPTEAKMLSAIDYGNNSRMFSLSKEDNIYYPMINKDDLVKISFDNSKNKNIKYAYALKISGYYKVIVPDKITSKYFVMDSLYANPEKLLRFSVTQLRETEKNIICDLP